MSNLSALLILAAAALLEAGGDAIVRTGLQGQGSASKLALIVLGGCVLTIYGIVVNTPSWDFGRLLGVYVTLFFVAAQVINKVVFHLEPTLPVLVGGGLIIAGGLLMTVWH